MESRAAAEQTTGVNRVLSFEINRHRVGDWEVNDLLNFELLDR